MSGSNIDFDLNAWLVRQIPFIVSLWILCATTTLAYLFTMIGAIDEISHIEFLITLDIALTLTLMQCAGLIFLNIVLRRHDFCDTIIKILLSLFVAGNFFIFHIVFIQDFSALSVFVQALLFVISIFILFQFLSSIAEFKWWRWFVSAVLLVGVSTNTIEFNRIMQIPKSSLLSNDNAIASERVKLVEFKQKPNIYLLSFDALAAPSVVREIMRIEQVGYEKVLNNEDFRWFRNAFSDGIHTVQSLNRLLAFDPAYYDELSKTHLQNWMFTGVQPSPLLQIFQKNGYRTFTYARDHYLGKDVGPYVNFRAGYPFGMCNIHHLAPSALKWGFGGYCSVFKSGGSWFTDIFLSTEDYQEFNEVYFITPHHFVDFLIREWSKERQQKTPFLVLMNIISPVHAPDHFSGTKEEHGKYNQYYSWLINNQTPEVMQMLIDDIKQNDPNAIIFIFGDHGAGITRTYLEQHGNFMTVSQPIRNASVWVDMGISSAIYPNDICQEYLSQDAGTILEKYALTSVVMRQLIRCLSNGDDPFATPVDYQIYSPVIGAGEFHYHALTFPKNNPGQYEDYLYEFPNRMTNYVIPILTE